MKPIISLKLKVMYFYFLIELFQECGKKRKFSFVVWSLQQTCLKKCVFLEKIQKKLQELW